MLTADSVLKVPQADGATVNRLRGVLPGGFYSSPKSPKFNELLARHYVLQKPENDSEVALPDLKV